MDDIEISRKNFLKWGGIFGAGLMLPGCARKSVLTPAEEKPAPLGLETFAASVCGLCSAGCAVRVRVVDGKAVGVSGAVDHLVNRGALCPKGAALLQELYHPDRLRSPLKRSGPRGGGAWSPISWEEALHLVGGRLRGSGFDAVTSSRVGDAAFEALAALGGRVRKMGFAAGELPFDAHLAMHGRALACDPAGARLLVSFGWDWLQSHPSPVEAQRLWGRLRASGARAGRLRRTALLRHRGERRFLDPGASRHGRLCRLERGPLSPGDGPA